MGAFFITATGTDIGKTFVAAGLIRHLRAAGCSIDAIKPVMSGYDSADAANSDAGALLQALDREPTPEAIEDISPWRYRAPLSPDMAAAREGRELDVDALIAHSRAAIAKTQNKKSTLLIEGVGGIMVPLDARRTVLDWMIALNMPVILVAGSYLGTISHTLTALDVLSRGGLDVRAIVINESAASAVPLEDTVVTLSRYTENLIGVPRIPDAAGTHPAFAEIAARLT
jgi:dethiobiotin synthetase